MNTSGELTQDTVQEHCRDLNLTCHYTSTEFVNYADARTKLAEYAHKLFHRRHLVFLIQDPGDILEIADKKEAEQVIRSLINNKNACYIQQKWTMTESHISTWFLGKMFSSSLKHWYDGYAHEYICFDKKYVVHPRCVKFISQTQDHFTLESEISQASKKRSDTILRLLQQQIQEIDAKYSHIKNKTKRFEIKTKDDLYPRTTFYLAQEYVMQFEHTKNPECIKKGYELYLRRANISGHFKEEQFEAYKRSIEILLDYQPQLGMSAEVADLLIRKQVDTALKMQERAELYITYINYLLYNEKLRSFQTQNQRTQDIELAHEYLNKLIKLEYPTRNVLFVNEYAYTKDRQELYRKVFPPKFEKPQECEVCWDSTDLQCLIPCSHWLCKNCTHHVFAQQGWFHEPKCFFCRQRVCKV